MLVEKSKNLQQILGATRRERRNKCGSRVHRRVQTRLSKTREKTLSILVSDEETLKPATTKQQRRLRYRSFTKVGEGFASFYQEVLRGIARTEARRINKRFFAKKSAQRSRRKPADTKPRRLSRTPSLRNRLDETRLSSTRRWKVDCQLSFRARQ